MANFLRQKILLIIVTATLLISIAGLFVANQGLAWLAHSTEVSGNGLSAKVEVSPNLIIGKSVDEITDDNLLFNVSFDGNARTDMVPVTRDESIPNTYLKYLYNHYAVDEETGYAKPGQELEFVDVPSENNSEYFVDYTVYIASAFKPLDVSALRATVTITDDNFMSYFNAVSVDFYIDTVSPEGYRGTTSVAKSKNNSEDKSVDLFLQQEGTVPLNTEGSIKVIMRCYFDGALRDEESGRAYINSEWVKTDSATVGVEFVAIEAN